MTEVSVEKILKRRSPVIEVFGPVVQGEGRLAGVPTYFIRFGGCDYRCSWCDSLYAVIPEQVRANAEKLTAEETADRIQALPAGPRWVTLSGGNPAMLELGVLVDRLHSDGLKVSVETQASRWKDWLVNVDCLTVSPKPPSSGMVSPEHDEETETFMGLAWEAGLHEEGALKIVVFDDVDLLWAELFFDRYPGWQMFLSVGTDPPAEGEPYEETLLRIADRYRWLCERAAVRTNLRDVVLLPQLHVIAHGHARGV